MQNSGHQNGDKSKISVAKEKKLVALATILVAISSPDMYIFFAFVKERFHNAVEIDILGIFEACSSLQIWPPQKFFRGEIIWGKYQDQTTVMTRMIPARFEPQNRSAEEKIILCLKPEWLFYQNWDHIYMYCPDSI